MFINCCLFCFCFLLLHLHLRMFCLLLFSFSCFACVSLLEYMFIIISFAYFYTIESFLCFCITFFFYRMLFKFSMHLCSLFCVGMMLWFPLFDLHVYVSMYVSHNGVIYSCGIINGHQYFVFALHFSQHNFYN